MADSLNSFGTRETLSVGADTFTIYRLPAAAERLGVSLDRLPFSIRILLENLLRYEDGVSVTADQVRAVAHWDPVAEPDTEIAFRPGRILLQDFTGVPAVVDLAAMRDAMAEMGGDPDKINPLQPVDLVIDHSVQVDAFGMADAFRINAEREFERNKERYQLLKWAQGAFRGFRVVPPDTGIVHQVNLEYLAPVVLVDENGNAYPDSLVGTDSHTTMIDGLGVLGWGVGGIEAEAAMLGQPVSMLIPQVMGVHLTGRLPEGATGTDLVLRVTELLRARNVVGKFVEFYGSGLSTLALAARATIANMCPEYGATVGFFPVDAETLRYLEFTGRDAGIVSRVEAYTKAQGLFRTDETPNPEFSEVLELDLGSIEPSLAGPKRPQDRIPLSGFKQSALKEIADQIAAGGGSEPVPVSQNGDSFDLDNGSIVIAAITSCTNTSNPEVMVGAGLLAKKAVERGLRTPPWVKTSLAPGSKVVTDYLDDAGLTPFLDQLGFDLVGYGCTTCIGNSGPLPDAIDKAVDEGHLAVAAVLSGNRNFEARVHNKVRSNYLASPPLVVAYALVGRTDVDLYNEPLGGGSDGQPVFLRDIWPTQAEVSAVIDASVRREMFVREYGDVFKGDERWAELEASTGDRFEWDPESTYVRRPPFFENLPRTPVAPTNIREARVLAVLGDSVTTDHISPAGAIARATPAAKYLDEHEVSVGAYNSYGSRRGNHEVMMRGTFANVRLRNGLVEREGGWTQHLPDGEEMTIWDAAERYREEGVPLILISGREYGSGSSRDWAAKGPYLQGVKAAIAISFERIHRSNLIGMGILPLQFVDGQTPESLGLTGRERYDIDGISNDIKPGDQLPVRALADDGTETAFVVRCRIDTPVEVDYYRHGGILQYVLRQLLES
ncbi:MAG: aconitate hydratase AcnA [Chloroflexi bacterium]|nr:aconitate hydratase AcnA [Chloroflexota bacterium]MDA1003400.1 aconitate hydratase AcnA [Chloroflexota bacterium]